MTHDSANARAMEDWPQQEFRFTHRDFRYLAQLAGEYAGINVPDSKRALVYSRLTRRLRQLKLDDFAQYCALLQQGNHKEIENFVNAITTNLTSFFREPHHFDFMRQRLMPAWTDGKNHAEVRVWCAGCSTGEEPYSVAMTVLGSHHGGCSLKLRLTATDLDSQVLAIAAAGIYPVERVGDLDSQLLHRWFLRGQGDRKGQVKVRQQLRRSVEFLQHNIVYDSLPEGGPFDAIFCRNVVIYFDQATQAEVFGKLARSLVPHGYLFVGHSESLVKKNEQFRLVGQSTYQKIR